MPQHRPTPISKTESAARRKRIARVARGFGFVGHVEYRHVFSKSGGAQFGLAELSGEDVLTVFAEAFDRDADPEDFSLEALIAHERGHQLLARDERVVRNLPDSWSDGSEEMVASLIGSLLVDDERDQQDLLLKALFHADALGIDSERAAVMLSELRALLQEIFR